MLCAALALAPATVTGVAAASTPGFVADASLLPRHVPPVAVTLVDAATVARRLTLAARQPGQAGLTALMQLARIAGMPVLDASQGGKVIAGIRGNVEVYPIEAGRLLVIHDLLRAHQSTSLSALFGLIQRGLATKHPVAASTLMAQLAGDLSADSASPKLAVRVWAQAVLTSSPAGAQLTASLPPADVSLDALQSTLLLLQWESTVLPVSHRIRHVSSVAPTERPADGISAVGDAVPGAEQAAAESSSGGCDLDNEVLQEILDATFNLAGAGRGALKDATLERFVDLGGEAGERAETELVRSQLIETLMPILETGLLAWAFQAKIEPDSPSFDRVKVTTENGHSADLTASFRFNTPDHSHLSHCASLFISAIWHEIDLPNNGAIQHAGVSWELVSGGQQGGDLGFVQMCGEACGKSPVLYGYTNENGTSTIKLEGLKQKADLSYSNESYERIATVRASVNPKDLENASAGMIKTITEAVSSAVTIFGFPPAGITKVGAHLLLDLGLLSTSKNVTVTDWVPGFTLHYLLNVGPPPVSDPAFTSTGNLALSADVRLTEVGDTNTFQGAGVLSYNQASYVLSGSEEANESTVDNYPPFDHSGCPSLGACPVPNCWETDLSKDVGSTPGQLAAVLTVSKDGSGNIVGIQSLKYGLQGITESYMQSENVTGDCSFYDGSQSEQATQDVDAALDSWANALNHSGRADIQTLPSGFARTSFQPPQEKVLGSDSDTFPQFGGEGVVSESLEIDNGDQ